MQVNRFKGPAALGAGSAGKDLCELVKERQEVRQRPQKVPTTQKARPKKAKGQRAGQTK